MENCKIGVPAHTTAQVEAEHQRLPQQTWDFSSGVVRALFQRGGAWLHQTVKYSVLPIIQKHTQTFCEHQSHKLNKIPSNFFNHLLPRLSSPRVEADIKSKMNDASAEFDPQFFVMVSIKSNLVRQWVTKIDNPFLVEGCRKSIVGSAIQAAPDSWCLQSIPQDIARYYTKSKGPPHSQ